MDFIFNNNHNPYFSCAAEKSGCFQKEEYDKAKMNLLYNIGRDVYGITDFSAFNTSTSYSLGKELFRLPANFYNPQKSSCDVGLGSFMSTIKNVYNPNLYVEKNEDCEIIVRLPQILSEITRSQALEEDMLEPLESYWRNHIQPEVDKYIATYDHSQYCDLL